MVNKKIISLIVCTAIFSGSIFAEEFKLEWPKLSGYLQTGVNYTNTSGTSTSTFQAKRLRLLMDGKVAENVDFRLQVEAFNGIVGSKNGNGQKNLQVMDAFATWKIAPEFKVRFGQFYTPLGYENYDISPATLETVDFSNIVYRMSCRNPYTYNLVDYGRDLGVMFIGDLWDSGEGFRYFHYDLAITNGTLPCSDDIDNYKDIYASITVRPFKNFNIKATYNFGKYNTMDHGSSLAMTGASTKGNPMHRFVGGAWYNDPNGLDLRSEVGFIKSTKNGKDYVNEFSSYVFAGYHLGKFLPMVRWDMYSDTINSSLKGANYNRVLAGLTYEVFKWMKFQLNYSHFFYDNKTSMDQVQLMGLFKF